jgi:hypothetical protein
VKQQQRLQQGQQKGRLVRFGVVLM